MVKQMDESIKTGCNMTTVEIEYLKNADAIVTSLWSLSDEIMFKYASGFVNEAPNDMSEMVGYPAWWLKEVGYAEGPPPPPTKPKCCKPGSSFQNSFLRREEDLPMLTGKAAMRYHLEMQ